MIEYDNETYVMQQYSGKYGGLENFDLDQIYTVMTLKLISVNLTESKNAI